MVFWLNSYYPRHRTSRIHKSSAIFRLAVMKWKPNSNHLIPNYYLRSEEHSLLWWNENQSPSIQCLTKILLAKAFFKLLPKFQCQGLTFCNRFKVHTTESAGRKWRMDVLLPTCFPSTGVIGLLSGWKRWLGWKIMSDWMKWKSALFMGGCI